MELYVYAPIGGRAYAYVVKKEDDHMSGKIDKTVTVGRFKGGEAQVRTILGGQGFEVKSLAMRSKDHTNEIWDITLANGRKVQLVAQNKSDKVSIKEL